MGVISFEFFSWYRSSEYKNFTVLFYGIAALTLGASIAEDAGTKLLMVQEVAKKRLQEKLFNPLSNTRPRINTMLR
jgi:hypothetical protein